MKTNKLISKKAIFSAIIIFLLPALHLLGQTIDYEHFTEQVDHLLKEQTTQSTPGAAVVVTEKGKPIFKQCYGLANLEYDIPISPRSVFNLASVSKQFTAFSILLLENEGKIHLEDDIHKYLPELPNYGKVVTIQQLLNHTSGIWEYSSIMWAFAGYSSYDYYTQDEVMDLIKRQEKLLFEPGSQWSYCNTNYLLLAQIVSRITEESFISWTRKNIFEPLEMEHTFFHETSFQVIKERATPYRKNKKGDYIDGSGNRNNYAGMSYLYTTIEDMVRWMDNFRTKNLGGNKVVDKMFQKGKLNNGSEIFYGFGLGIHNKHGKKVIDHSGQTGGYKAQMIYCPEDEVGIAILANERSFNAERLTNQIFDLYLGIEPEEKKEKLRTEKKSNFSIDSAHVEDYIGMFLIEGDSSNLALCYLGENTFYGIFEGLGQDYFHPISIKEFVTPNNSVSIVFTPDENNKLNRFKLDLKGDIMWANRIDFVRPGASQLSALYAGKYFSEALGTVYEIGVIDNNIVLKHRRHKDQLFQHVGEDEFAGGYGILRFKKDHEGHITSFNILDEFFNYIPLKFKKI